MFCPQCRAEYREGFSRCSDCGVDLVGALSIPEEVDSRSALNERPDKAPPAYFLAWFLPMSIFCIFYLFIWFRPSLLQMPVLAYPLVILILVLNLGGLWMIYQSIRYERKVLRYLLLSFVPFMFIWYRLVRYPLRRELPRLP
jgi:hypothetical protein